MVVLLGYHALRLLLNLLAREYDQQQPADSKRFNYGDSAEETLGDIESVIEDVEDYLHGIQSKKYRLLVLEGIFCSLFTHTGHCKEHIPEGRGYQFLATSEVFGAILGLLQRMLSETFSASQPLEGSLHDRVTRLLAGVRLATEYASTTHSTLVLQ